MQYLSFLPLQTRLLLRRRQQLLTFLLLAASILLVWSMIQSAPMVLNDVRAMDSPILCDPYAQPGFLNDSSNTAHWQVLNSLKPVCNATDFLDVVKQSASGKVDSLPRALTNKLVLLIGDSFERTVVWHFCDQVGSPMVLAKLNGDLLPANATHSEYPQGLSRSCVISDKKGGIFAIVSVFHFGVASNLTKLEKNHWDRGYSPKETVERVKWLPYFLRAIASHVFPEFCNLAKQECPPPKYFKKVKNSKLNDSVPPLLDPKNPFWFPKPDLILTQSMLWDLMLRNEDQQFDAFANDWVFGMREFINVVQETFGGAVKNVKTRNGEILPRYLIRTTPLPDEKDGNGKTFHTEEKFSPVNALNYLMRSGYLNSDVLVHESHHDNTKSKDKKNLEAKQVGLLDWDKLMAGTQSHSDDGLHPNMFSSNAFIQLLFSRLELLYQGTPRY